MCLWLKLHWSELARLRAQPGAEEDLHLFDVFGREGFVATHALAPSLAPALVPVAAPAAPAPAPPRLLRVLEPLPPGAPLDPSLGRGDAPRVRVARRRARDFFAVLVTPRFLRDHSAGGYADMLALPRHAARGER